jgi:predicted ribosome-associated RNA-binding protein Tma20
MLEHPLSLHNRLPRRTTNHFPRSGGREVAINRIAGESVLKGADVFSPGLLAVTPGVAAGDLVAVSVALETKCVAWGGPAAGDGLACCS